MTSNFVERKLITANLVILKIDTPGLWTVETSTSTKKSSYVKNMANLAWTEAPMTKLGYSRYTCLFSDN